MKDKKLFIKTVIFIGAIVLMNIIIRAFEPTISASVAVQQAYDTFDSSAKLKIYNAVKSYSSIGWLLIGLAVYWKEIKTIFKK